MMLQIYKYKDMQIYKLSKKEKYFDEPKTYRRHFETDYIFKKLFKIRGKIKIRNFPNIF